VTVTTRDGVVRLEGMIGGDPLDLIAALRITYRVAGVRRVIDDLDTHDFDNGP
jgi:osmotically-inducible protein OsmY